MGTGKTWLEGLVIVAAAVAIQVLSDYLKDVTLSQWAILIFGGGIGYIGHGARTGT